MTTSERQLEDEIVARLVDLKYVYRADIRDRAALEQNFREQFQALNRVKLTDPEFNRLLDEIVTPDLFTTATTLRTIDTFNRDDGTPLKYTLVNLEYWCKNTFEVVKLLRISTDYSHHRCDVILLINGVPAVQIELKTLGINPRRAMEQIVEYKNDPGNGYTKTLLCFLQLFVVSNRDKTYYFANNNLRHFSFDAEERYLPIYQFADPDNNKVSHIDDCAEQFLAKCTLGQMFSRPRKPSKFSTRVGAGLAWIPPRWTMPANPTTISRWTTSETLRVLYRTTGDKGTEARRPVLYLWSA